LGCLRVFVGGAASMVKYGGIEEDEAEEDKMI
jgi:hypothetical protein